MTEDFTVEASVERSVVPTAVVDVVSSSPHLPGEFAREIHIFADADVVDQQHTSFTHNRPTNRVDTCIGRCTFLMTILAIGGSCFVAVMVWQTHDASRRDSAGDNTGDYSLEAYYDRLHEAMEARGVPGLLNPSTQTYEALEWMAFQDGSALNGQLQDLEDIYQRYALVVFYFSTAGDDFWNADWVNPGVHECEFEGLECDENRRVIAMNMHQKSLLGEIPEEMRLLTNLEILDFHNNRLYGTVPSFVLESLPKLRGLDLSFNELTGTLPNDWSFPTDLESLVMEVNFLTGSLPEKIPPMLQLLKLNQNQISGTIPADRWLQHYRNDRSEYLDPMAPSSHPLMLFDLSDSYIGGTLPNSLATLFTRLESLSLGATGLSGSIPSELGQLPLQEIALAMTQVSGTIPKEIWRSSTLQYFVLVSTSISGTIPTEVGYLSSIQTLNLVETKISGTLPTELGLLQNLERLQLSSTLMSGTIPSEFGRLDKLSHLWLHLTQLEGTVPAELCSLSNIANDLRVDCGGGADPRIPQCSCCNYCY